MSQKITFLLLLLLSATSCVDRQPQNEEPLRVKVARATPTAGGQRKEFPLAPLTHNCATNTFQHGIDVYGFCGSAGSLA
ncbi:hypothetical protein [Alistipes putredinis]|uniref:hypothetical protein n=1 Tax=Alistipes putredinis TaxID=28117 RepID=UPI00242CBC1B|nr:hypothetical protein [Alistipes putredinis]MBS6652400.1 hypothetical protein [Alistipes putredinis]